MKSARVADVYERAHERHTRKQQAPVGIQRNSSVYAALGHRRRGWQAQEGQAAQPVQGRAGVSINEIRAGIVADYVADHEAANQIVGRFIRKKKTDNRAHIVWFVDNQHPTYRRGCTAMFRKLEKIDGYTFYHPVTDPSSVPELADTAKKCA